MYEVQRTFWDYLENADNFSKTDPHLKRLYAEKYVYHSPLIQELPRKEPAIVTLGGGRQIGKTTLLKQWMEDLLENRVKPEAICFFSGELMGDYQSLYNIIQNQLTQMPENDLKYIILDEDSRFHFFQEYNNGLCCLPQVLNLCNG